MTEVAGKPAEYLSEQNREQVLAQFKAGTFQQLLVRLQQGATTTNGVFGIKYPGYLDRLIEEIQSLTPGATLRQALEAAFPDLRLVFLTRRNKVRQAVSHWRAIKSDLWHLAKDGQAKAPPKDAYRFEAIDTLVHDIVMREAAWQQVFEEIEAEPLTVAYEDFASDPEKITRMVLGFLGLQALPGWRLGELPIRPIADELSEAWVQRYRAERQAKWERVIW